MTAQGATLPKTVSILPLAAALLIGSIAGPAAAQVMLHVNDETELAAAIDAANADLLNAYTIFLDADIVLTQALPTVTSIVTIAAASGDTIERSSAPGTPPFRILTLTAGAGQGHLTLERITVANGLTQSQGVAEGGGIWVGGSPPSLPRTQLDLIEVTVRDNRAQGLGGLLNGGNTRGGGVFVDGESVLTVERCWFENNRAIGTQPANSNYSGGFAEGGAIHCRLCRSSHLHDSTFRDNLAQGGNGGNGTVAGRAYGGAVFALNPSEGVLGITGNLFEGNRAQGGNRTPTSSGGGEAGGGAANLSSLNGIAFSGNTFKSNMTRGGGGASGRGGALLLSTGPVSFGADRFESNSITGNPGRGGGVYLDNASTVTGSDLVFVGNSAGQDGGAIYRRRGTQSIDNSCFVNNSKFALAAEGPAASHVLDDNWWGSPTGPGPNAGTGLGDTLSSAYTVSTFLAASPAGLGCPMADRDPLVVSKTFAPAAVVLNGFSTATITITNTNGVPVSDLTFTDSLPSGIVATALVSSTCGGSPSVVSDQISLTGGSVGASGSCTVSVTVQGTVNGIHTNPSFVAGRSDSSEVDGTANPATLTVGLTLDATVEGLVFEDVDGDGTQGAGEPGLAGVEVHLNAGGATQVATTGPDGQYSAAVPSGSIEVDIVDATLPPASTQTAGTDPTTINVAPGGVGNDTDGFRSLGTLLGHLFEDTNGNGAQDAGEPDLASVDVVITDRTGVPQTETSDAAGDYSASVVSGAVDVDVDDATLPAGYVLTAGVDPSQIDVPGGGAGHDTDGYRPPLGTLDGVIYEDTNDSGGRDMGEPGIGGVQVKVTDSANRVHPVTTNATGNYSVDLPAGSAETDIDEATLPPGSSQTEGTDPSSFTIVSGGTENDLDGFRPGVGTANGRIYGDTNGNGTQDAGEPGLAGIDVTVTDRSGIAQSLTSNAAGDYSATVLAGPVTIDLDDADLPAGWAQTQGTDPTVISVPGSADGSGVGSDVDGFQPPPGTVTVLIYEDLDGNGTQNGADPVLPGVDVTITNSAGVSQTLTTNASGMVSAVVPVGATTLDVDESTLPSGSTQTEGTDPTIVAVTSGGTHSDVDGFLPAEGTVDGHLFEDLDGGGSQGAGEPDLAGVDVVITDRLGRAQTVTSDAGGDYSASALVGGATVDVVEATLRPGSVQTAGTDPTAVSVPLVGSATDVDGFQPPSGTVDGHVYEDTNGNGGEDGGEPGLSGVDVTITDRLSRTFTATTDASGDYSLSVLSGPATLDIDAATVPAGWIQTEGTDPTAVTVPVSGSVSDRDGFRPPIDFGDAPDPVGATAGSYPTLEAHDGARHIPVGALLGSLRDGETEGQASALADGDDGDGVDDEDGVTFTSQVVPAASTTVEVVASAAAVLDAWVDFDRDGDWTADEKVFDGTSLGAGPNELAFAVPADAVAGPSFARFRITSAGIALPTGLAADGEVEDYAVEIQPLAQFSVSDVTLDEGTGGTTTFDFTVSRDHNLTPVSVQVATAAGTATAGSDFTAVALQTLTFPIGGALEQTLSVQVSGDAVVELDETFEVELSNPVGGALLDATGTGTIRNDDSATLSIAPAEKDEDAGPLTFTVTLTGETDAAFTVDFATSDIAGQAVAGVDYTATSGSSGTALTFAGSPGETREIDVPLTADAVVETDETLRMTISNVLGSAGLPVLGTDHADGTIRNDDVAAITIADVSGPEGAAGETTPFVLHAYLDTETDLPISVDFQTADGSALIADGDYDGAAATVTFMPGETEATITVLVRGDATEEPDEVFYVDLSNGLPSAVTSIADARAAVTIEDDDDLGPATVVGVAANPGGEIAECGDVRAGLRQLEAVFDQALRDPPGDGTAGDVTNPASYLLVHAGPDGDFSTSSCAGGPAGDDLAVGLVDVAWNGSTRTATLYVAPGGPAEGLFQLHACAELSDLFGNPLDGDAQGGPSEDFVRRFRVDPFNLFRNGHFDHCATVTPSLEPWQPTSTDPNTVDAGGADALGSPLSASARVSSVIPDLSTLLQCVGVSGGGPYELRALLRSAPSAGTHGWTLRFCDYYSAVDCTGSSLGLQSLLSTLEPTGGLFVEVGGTFEPPAAAASALCGIGVAPTSLDSPFDVEIDQLFLGAESAGAVFSDGFESGDVSGWSFAVP